MRTRSENRGIDGVSWTRIFSTSRKRPARRPQLGSPPDRSRGPARARVGVGLGGVEKSCEVNSPRNPEDVGALREPYLKFLEYNMDFPDPENILVPLYHSRSIVNELNSRYANARLDGLLEQSEVEPSWGRRAGLFREVEKILVQDTPSIPLFSERVRIALLPRVRGVRLPAMGFIFLDVKDIWLED